MAYDPVPGIASHSKVGACGSPDPRGHAARRGVAERARGRLFNRPLISTCPNADARPGRTRHQRAHRRQDPHGRLRAIRFHPEGRRRKEHRAGRCKCRPRSRQGTTTPRDMPHLWSSESAPREGPPPAHVNRSVGSPCRPPRCRPQDLAETGSRDLARATTRCPSRPRPNQFGFRNVANRSARPPAVGASLRLRGTP